MNDEVKMKKCRCCGTFFELKNNRSFQCPKCAERVDRIRRESRYLVNYRDRDEFIDNVFINEEYWKNLIPTEIAIVETVNILKDFGVKVYEIPYFKNYKELNDWKNKLINKALN